MEFISYEKSYVLQPANSPAKQRFPLFVCCNNNITIKPRWRTGIAAIIAVNVFPLAVGVTINRFLPSATPFDSANSCGGYNSEYPSIFKILCKSILSPPSKRRLGSLIILMRSELICSIISPNKNNVLTVMIAKCQNLFATHMLQSGMDYSKENVNQKIKEYRNHLAVFWQNYYYMT